MKRLNLSVATFLIGLIASVMIMIHFIADGQNLVKFASISYSKKTEFSDIKPHDWQVESNNQVIVHIQPKIAEKFLSNALAKSSSSHGWPQQRAWHCKAHYQLCVKEL